MPRIYQLNPPPNPFWDFVAGIEDYPLFGNPAPHRHINEPEGSHPQNERTQSSPGMSETARGKQPDAEDPPEVDPSTVHPENTREMPWRGRGRFAQAFEGEDSRRGRGHHHCRGRGGRGSHGPPPFMFGGPFWARGGFGGHPGPHGPPGQHGPPPPPGPHHHGPPGPHHHRGRDHGPHHRGPPGRHPGFDLSGFLNNLGEKLGIDLTGAVEGLGLDRFSETRLNQEADFEPRTDIFENDQQYTVHLSVPGAKKEDVGVDYDGENSILRVSGVVHRPGVDEQMLNELVVDGRKRETGVFEKAIRLGTKNDPASIDVAGIHARMTDGVLVIRIPKVEVVHEKREVPIAGHSPPSYEDSEELFDAEHEAAASHHEAEPAQLFASEKPKEQPHETPASQGESEQETKTAPKAVSTTIAEAEKAPSKEELPTSKPDQTHEESDWEKYSDDEEGDFVKIDVN